MQRPKSAEFKEAGEPCVFLTKSSVTAESMQRSKEAQSSKITVYIKNTKLRKEAGAG
jgi:hypothetical protein